MVKTEEGGLMPCRKEANSDQYHVEGEVMLAPKELLKTILNTCTPVFRAAGDIPKIVMVPLPRYTRNGCCEDKDHATNCANPEYITQLLADLDSMRRQIKDLCFSANLRNISVINLGRTVEENKESWGSDPVHLKGEGYSIITNKLIQEAKRLLSTNKQVCRSNPSAAERNRKRDNSLSSGGVCKKQRLHHHPAARGLSGGFNGGQQGFQRDHNRDHWNLASSKRHYHRGRGHDGGRGRGCFY